MFSTTYTTFVTSVLGKLAHFFFQIEVITVAFCVIHRDSVSSSEIIGKNIWDSINMSLYIQYSLTVVFFNVL